MNNKIYVDSTHVCVSKTNDGIARMQKKFIIECLTTFKNMPIQIFQIKNMQFLTNFKLQQFLLNLPESDIAESEIAFQSGDIIFLASQKYFLQSDVKQIAKHGIIVIPFIHDIIPITHPEFCVENKEFYSWIMQIVACQFGVIVNSQYTIETIQQYVKLPCFAVSHLGCEKDNISFTPVPLPKGTNVLMVSTIEPRKKYEETLLAFEEIWKKDDSIHLIIVGTYGWKMDNFYQRLKHHPLLDKNIFLLSNIEDSELNFLYKNCDLFLFSSEIEGFGLGTIEAARFGTPLLLRDIPIFREIAGDHATYFSSFEQLPEMILKKEWKRSDGMPVKSWSDFTGTCLMQMLHIRKLMLEKYQFFTSS